MDITITLNQDEIIESIKMKLAEQDIVTAGKDIDFNFVAGRGINGASAVLTVKGDLPLAADPLNIMDVPEEKKVVAPVLKKVEPKKAAAKVVAEPVAEALFTEEKKEEVVVEPEVKKEAAPVDDPFAEEEKAEADAELAKVAAAAKVAEEAAAQNLQEEGSLFAA